MSQMTCLSVSVALCTCNGEPYLQEQLDSILAQTRLPDEIVLHDDRSDDQTLRIAQEYARMHPALFRITSNSERQGVTANFEQALRATMGQLVLLCDQDDVWRPDKIEQLHAVFEAVPALDLLFTNARLVNDRSSPIGASLFDALDLSARERALVKAGRAFESLMRRNLATGATVALRRRLLARALPLPTSWLHDGWLALIAAATGHVDLLDVALIDYRQHATNQIGMQPPSIRGQLRRLLSPPIDLRPRFAERAQALEERLQMLCDVPADRLSAARDKTLHSQARGRLPQARLARLLPVLQEAMTGRYARCSTGWRSIVRDLVEPINAAAGRLPLAASTPPDGRSSSS